MEDWYEYLKNRIIPELKTGYRSNVRRAYYHGMIRMARAADLIDDKQLIELVELVLGFDESEE